MSSIQVVVAAMNQNDLSLAEKMNIRTDILIANQANRFDYSESSYNENKVEMITSPTKGVGLNRNIGLQFSQADIILLSDDDIVFHDNYEEIIEKAFEELPLADVIIFEMQFIKDGKIYDVDHLKTRRLHLWNGLSFGTYQIAIRNKSLKRSNVHFTHLFGGGCIYSCGEDSLFLIDCFRKGLKIYSYDGLIGDNYRDSSSWFNGYTEKFFFDRGAFASCAFPKISRLICFYYLLAYRNVKEFSIIQKMRLMLQGVNGFSKLSVYENRSEK